MVMLSSFVVGVVLGFLCHGCADNDMAEDSDMKTLQVRVASSAGIGHRSSSRDSCPTHAGSAGVSDENGQTGSDIDSTSAAVCAKVSGRTKGVGPNEVSGSSGASSQGRSSASCQSHAFNCADGLDESPEGHLQGKNSTTKIDSQGTRHETKATGDAGDRGRTSSSKAKQSRTVLKSQRGYCSEEYTDIGSSDSRNTNTLDLGGHGGPVGNDSSCDREHQVKTREKTPTMQHRRDDLPECGRDLGTFAIASRPGEYAQRRPRSCLPLSADVNGPCPSDWCRCWANHWQSRELPGAMDQCGCDLCTDAASYCDTLSYCCTVAGSHTSSEDSGCARTWPPSLPAGHMAELPDGRLSPEEGISQWLQGSGQCFSRDFLRCPNPQDSRFGSNRGTVCGCADGVGVSSTSSKRLPPGGMEPRQRRQFSSGQSEEHRIQFQTYMDGLRTGRGSGRVWTGYPGPSGLTDAKAKLSCIEEDGERVLSGILSGPGGAHRAVGSSVGPPGPPGPPRPPRDVKPIAYAAASQNDCVISDRNETVCSLDPSGVSPPQGNRPKSIVGGSPLCSEKSSPPGVPMVNYGNEQTLKAQGEYSNIAKMPCHSQKSPTVSRTNINHEPTPKCDHEPSFSQKQFSPDVSRTGYYREQPVTSREPQSEPVWSTNYAKSCVSPNAQRASYSSDPQTRPHSYNPNISSPIAHGPNYSNETFREKKAFVFSDGYSSPEAQWANNNQEQTRATNKISDHSHNVSLNVTGNPNYYDNSEPVRKQGNDPQSLITNRTVFTPSPHDIISSPRVGRAIYSPNSISPPLRRPHSLSAAEGSYLHARSGTAIASNVPPYRPRQTTGPTNSKTNEITTKNPPSGLESAV